MSFRGSLKAKETIERGIAEGRKILAVGDPDVDGLFSLLFICQMLDILNVKYEYYVNGGRRHGFFLNPEDYKGYLLITGDFAITRKEVETMVANDIYLVSTDHHDIEANFIEYDNAVVINNQYPFEPEENRYLSGAGVLYELFSEIFPEFQSAERRAIVGITLLSDVRAIENDKARAYLRSTYNSEEPYIRYLIECTLTGDFTFGTPKMDRSFIDFTFSPTVNAMLRFDQTDKAIQFIFGNGLDTSTDWRVKQKELIETMMSEVEVLDLNGCYILAVDASKFQDDITNFIGLLCSKFKNKGKTSVIFAYNNGRIIRASCRGLYDDIDYRGNFIELGINAQGHHTAFGIMDFYPDATTWERINNVILNLEKNHEDTKTIVEVNNLSSIMVTKGMKIATDNCFVRDMYRTYIKYTGSRAIEVKHKYKTVEFDQTDYMNHVTPAFNSGGASYKYLLDKDGNKITKYMEYLVDGRTIKSFGVTIQEGLIMPILEKGYINLYVV